MIELVIVLLLVLINGFFAMSEMAVVTSRRSRLKQMAAERRGAQAALELHEHPERFLSTVQIGITLIGVLSGYVGGEAIGLAIAAFLTETFNIPFDYSENIGIGIAVAFIAGLSLLIGELLPKRLALLRAESIAARVSWPMKSLSLAAAPAVNLLSLLTRSILRLFGVHEDQTQRVSEEEIRLLVSESHEQGVIDNDERNMMNRVLRLGDRDAASLMTPRTRIVWLDATASDEANLKTMRETPFSRYPVYRGSDQDVIGILQVKMLAGRIGHRNPGLFNDLQKPVYVAEGTRAMNLLDTFREESTSLALVVDEYGDIVGMITLNDVLGAVLGRLGSIGANPDEASPVVQRADGSLLVDGSLSSDDLRELLGVGELPNETEHEYHTVAGLVVSHYGHIPQIGEQFEWNGWVFEVIDLDGARIDKLLIRRSEPEEERAGGTD
ncbi:hemolysin family protein [Pseudomarimonas arenosa]|uniref:HlyC/CorC family transporter n=1 Tax=Pseudomarimonas arenosa TaxID=2774145 RepID=A0AAW3ZS87_9GAMM|nr:hemolysin family protein [Pseudomarimonas arenosa]MBD8527725.1 HlyC/CorC family transporter [Pseudomarimonas arenosa]